MEEVFPAELEQFLEPGLSYLVCRVDAPDLAEHLSDYLRQHNIPPERKHSFVDKSQNQWLVLSVGTDSARPLVLELIEGGFPATIYGIDANPI